MNKTEQSVTKIKTEITQNYICIICKIAAAIPKIFKCFHFCTCLQCLVLFLCHACVPDVFLRLK